MDKLNEILQKRFGHATFRAGQQEIIEQIIEKKDVIAILSYRNGEITSLPTTSLSDGRYCGYCVTSFVPYARSSRTIENTWRKKSYCY